MQRQKGSSRSGPTSQPFPPPLPDIPSLKGGGLRGPVPPPDPPASAQRSSRPNSNPGYMWDGVNLMQGVGLAIALAGLGGGLGLGLYRLGIGLTGSNSVLKPLALTEKDWKHPPNSRLRQGQLQHTLAGNQTQVSQLNNQSWGNVSLQLNSQLLQGSQAIAGVAVRINGSNDQNFYYLLVRGDGTASLGKHSNQGWQNRVNWTKIPSFKPDQNQLELVAQGDRLTGLVNQQKIGSFQDTAYPTGKVALLSRQETQGNAVVGFQDVRLKLTEPQDLALSPEQTVLNYYRDYLKQPGVAHLDLIDRVEVYDQQRLRFDYDETQLQVGLRYTFKNGTSLCESRQLNFYFDRSQQQWQHHPAEKIRPQPRCKL